MKGFKFIDNYVYGLYIYMQAVDLFVINRFLLVWEKVHFSFEFQNQIGIVDAIIHFKGRSPSLYIFSMMLL